MGIYHDLAPFYDAMNAEIDYDDWAEAADRVIRRFVKSAVPCVLDLGCGTGSMTIALSKRGYDMVGLDLSPEMLSIAYDRADAAGVGDRIQWTQQDMCDFSLCGQVDAVVSPVSATGAAVSGTVGAALVTSVVLLPQPVSAASIASARTAARIL